jgi:hypothetical protein
MALTVRPLTAEETEALQRFAGSCRAPHRVAQRAPIIWASVQGEPAPDIAHHVGLSAFRVRTWIHRFNRHGLAG